MIELIVLNGVLWSPSHPNVYPPPAPPATALVVKSVFQEEQLYIPELTLTDENGTPYIR